MEDEPGAGAGVAVLLEPLRQRVPRQHHGARQPRHPPPGHAARYNSVNIHYNLTCAMFSRLRQNLNCCKPVYLRSDVSKESSSAGDIFNRRNIQCFLGRMPSFKKCLWGFMKCDSPIRLQAKSHIQRNVTIKTSYILKEKVVEAEEQTTNLMLVEERCNCDSI